MEFENEKCNILCCREDLVCHNICNGSHSAQECCKACVLPRCHECARHIFAEEPVMPAAALATDMMIYCAPTDLHTENVTAMEMLCASVCVTSMIWCTLEQRAVQGTLCYG